MHYSIVGRCNCFDPARPVEPAHLPSTLSAFLLLPTISVAHATPRLIDRLRLYGIFMPFSRALRARGSLCKGIKKNFSTPPSENPAPPDFRLPGRRCAASATATQRPPAIFNAGNSTNPFDVLGCTRLSVQGRQRRFSPCSNGRQDHGFFSGTAKARTKTAYYNVVGIQ